MCIYPCRCAGCAVMDVFCVAFRRTVSLSDGSLQQHQCPVPGKCHNEALALSVICSRTGLHNSPQHVSPGYANTILGNLNELPPQSLIYSRMYWSLDWIYILMKVKIYAVRVVGCSCDYVNHAMRLHNASHASIFSSRACDTAKKLMVAIFRDRLRVQVVCVP